MTSSTGMAASSWAGAGPGSVLRPGAGVKFQDLLPTGNPIVLPFGNMGPADPEEQHEHWT